MESLMHRPYVAVPIVLRRLRSRIEEFREAKKNYIKVWKEECEKNYAKWLQSQTTSFRQLDARLMRAKTLINEAEVAAEEVRLVKNKFVSCECLEHHVKVGSWKLNLPTVTVAWPYSYALADNLNMN
jgi:histone deacetylase complex regulatory component SIN3